MIEREFISQKTKEHYIRKYVEEKLPRAGISEIKLKKIPLGEKIIISTSRPSLVVGSKGANIKELTKTLKKKFHLENPQIEINEVKDPFLDAHIVAEKIASSLERFGSARFKSIGHKTMENVLQAGARGVEVLLSGKIPGARAKRWRFYQGYLKKCGEISVEGVRKAQARALLKAGIIGIQVAIMPPDLDLPDHIFIKDEVPAAEAAPSAAPAPAAEEASSEKPKKTRKKKSSSKKSSSEPSSESSGSPEASPSGSDTSATPTPSGETPSGETFSLSPPGDEPAAALPDDNTPNDDTPEKAGGNA